MAKLELSRLALFVVEWVLSALCLGLFPSQLYRILKTDGRPVCAIGSVAFCRFGISWTLIGLLILTASIVWHLCVLLVSFLFYIVLQAYDVPCIEHTLSLYAACALAFSTAILNNVEFCTHCALPVVVEMLIAASLACWWLVGAIAFSAAPLNTEIDDVTSTARKALRTSAWLLVLLYFVSSVVAWFIARNESLCSDPFAQHDPSHNAIDANERFTQL